VSRITRRQFLANGAKGVALVSVPVFFRVDPLAALSGPAGGSMEAGDYYRRFGVDEKTVRDVMAVALERGGDYCDLYFQHSLGNYVGLEDKQVNRAYTNVDFGLGIRVLKGDQTGFSFTEEITPKAMKQAARTAANIASGSATSPAAKLAFHPAADYYPIETSWEEVRIDRKIPYLEKLNELVFAADPRIVKSQIWFSDDTSYVLLVTSEGRVVCDYRPMTRLTVTCTAEQDGRREEGYYDLSGREGIEFYTPGRLEHLASMAVQRAVGLFAAVKPAAGEMEVVLAAGSSGILLHEAIGHGMEADFNRKGISIFADKIGKPVAEKFVSIVDDGTNPNLRGSLNVDDEGNDTEKTFLVENGTMRSYLHDRISAQHYGVRSTGSGRRQSFRHPPMPRMRNTYMLPGPHTRDEIIASVNKGLYAEAFTNGQVFIGAGDFSFYVKTGYLIEDGRLARPVKDINIIGNGPDVLSKIVMVGDDLKFAEGGWNCGKNGQRVPVSQGLPTVKVSSITVGGVSA
jgi:TldD protein